jgi:Nitrogenase molybdenum-iron protein, alpha and beta chains
MTNDTGGQLVKTPREENWQTGNTFAGPLKKLLDKDVENTAQERRSYDMCVCPPCSCSGTLSMINKTVILFNSPPGCGEEGMLSWRTFHMQSWQQMGLNRQPEWYTTVVVHNNMSRREIVFGGGDNMHQSVHKAYERYKPKMIVILNTCPPAIIGDDLEGIGALLKKEFKDKCYILPIRSEGISTPIWSNAWDLSLIALMDNVMKPPKHRNPKKINIFSNFTYFYDDWVELARIVEAIGLEPSGRFGSLPGYSEIEDIEKMSEASCNAAACSNFARSAFDRMETEFNIPFVEFPSQAMGVELSEEWLMAIASVFGLEKKPVLLSKRRRISCGNQ